MKNNSGVAMSVVIVSILLLSVLAAAALTFGFHQRKLAESASGTRTQNFYLARSGSIDADERLRTDNGLTYAADPDCDNTARDPDCDPEPYNLDVDGDGTPDVVVDISATDSGTGLRTVNSTSL